MKKSIGLVGSRVSRVRVRLGYVICESIGLVGLGLVLLLLLLLAYVIWMDFFPVINGMTIYSQDFLWEDGTHFFPQKS